MEESNVNVTEEVIDNVEHVEGDVVDAIDTARDVAQKVIVGVSEDVGEGIGNIAKGVGVLAFTGLVTVIAAAGYGVYRGAKWVGGKISSGSKKNKDDKASEQPAQAENTEEVQQEADDNKKAKK